MITMMAAACFAGGFCQITAQETAEPEMLEIRYTQGDTSYTNYVVKDVAVLRFDINITDLHLLEGLTKLHTLSIRRIGNYNHMLTRLILPKDLGKEADWPLRLYVIPYSLTFQVHKDMGRFLLNDYIRIPSAKDLIRNREPDDDGVFRIPIPTSYAIDDDNFFTIEVHGVDPQIWLNRQEGGVEIVWDRGQLQSAPSIDGPWTDITFDDTRRLFIRSSSPAEFFRVKPE